MRRMVVTALAAAIAASVALAQTPVIPPTNAPKAPAAMNQSEVAIVVRGCLRGRILRPSQSSQLNAVFAGLNASEFILNGSGELLQQIRAEHDGHYAEIDGVAKPPRSVLPDDGTVSQTKVGRGVVTLSRRRRQGAQPDAPRQVPLTITSFTHIDTSCSER